MTTLYALITALVMSSTGTLERASIVEGLTRSEQPQDTTIVLPLYHEMTEEEQDRAVAALKRAVAGSSAAASGSV